MKYIIRTTALTVVPEDASLFSGRATTVNVVNEAAGEFVEVEQESGKIQINPDEWPTLREAVDRMIAECRE